jgi:hypothetical protein
MGGESRLSLRPVPVSRKTAKGFPAHSRGVLPPKEQLKGCFFCRAALICNLEVA